MGASSPSRWRWQKVFSLVRDDPVSQECPELHTQTLEKQEPGRGGGHCASPNTHTSPNTGTCCSDPRREASPVLPGLIFQGNSEFCVNLMGNPFTVNENPWCGATLTGTGLWVGFSCQAALCQVQGFLTLSPLTGSSVQGLLGEKWRYLLSTPTTLVRLQVANKIK